MRIRALGLLGAGMVGLFACNLVASRELATAFNQGVLDSKTDPYYARSQRATDTVMWRMRDELGEGYFGQGGPGSPGHDARVVAWLQLLHDHAADFMDSSLRAWFAGDASADLSFEDDDHGSDKAAPASQQAIQKAITKSGIAPPSTPVCDGRTRNPAAIAELADYVRFRVALQRAVTVTGKLVDERFATMDEVHSAAERAFGDTAAYLRTRQWKRELDHPVTGLVVKGGAATGIFSAGVVWVTLNMIDKCMQDDACRKRHPGFAMASGTSTGATVVGATDIFHTKLDDPKHRSEKLGDFLNWYLCSSMNDLYCVRNHVAFNLARGDGADPAKVQDALLDFKGLAAKIEQNYQCSEMTNGMELILNTVDFRTGRLYSLSDQDTATLRSRWDVAQAIVSSAALPFIVRPTYHLPVDPVPDAGNYAYLDGGIRSELPLLALVRRGVERLLVVSSGSSITGDNTPLPNALGMAIRYIDISTGGVTEAEIDSARTSAEASRLAEYDYCRALVRDDATKKSRGEVGTALCTGTCDADYLCSGDYERVCTRDTKNLHLAQNNEQIVAHTFQVTNVWRNEDRIPGLPGYAFDPVEQRRLMLAGAESAREKCTQIATTLGVDVGTGPDQVDLQKLYAWCTPPLPSVESVCGAAKIAELKKSPDAKNCADDEPPSPSPDAGNSAATCPRSP